MDISRSRGALTDTALGFVAAGEATGGTAAGGGAAVVAGADGATATGVAAFTEGSTFGTDAGAVAGFIGAAVVAAGTAAAGLGEVGNGCLWPPTAGGWVECAEAPPPDTPGGVGGAGGTSAALDNHSIKITRSKRLTAVGARDPPRKK